MDNNTGGTSRREFLQGAAGLGISAKLAPGALTSTAPRPNIVYIHSHDTGRYLQPYGHAVPTPHLQQLAKEGVLFRQMHTAAPTCSPSRAALLTGCCPHRNGMLGLAHLGWGLNDYHQHIIHTLRKVGYTSVLSGLQHIAVDPKVIGYDLILKHPSNQAKDVAPLAAAYIENHGHEQPFFLSVGFFETHRPFAAPTSADDPDYILPPQPLPDAPAVREDLAAFHASARDLDRGVGQVLDALERSGLAANTIVISTTDHGIAFPEMKCNMYDAGSGVSLIMRGPRDFKPGTVCEALLSQIDVFPTICELLEIERPAWLEGKSFLPILRGQTKKVNDEIFCEVTYHAAYEPKRSVRTDRWKYIRRFDGRDKPVLVNCDASPSRTYWLERDWPHQRPEQPEELYDLVFDPAERNNLVKDQRHAAELSDLRERLDSWMRRTDDPLLRGPVPLPAGYLIKSPDAITAEGLPDMEKMAQSK